MFLKSERFVCVFLLEMTRGLFAGRGSETAARFKKNSGNGRGKNNFVAKIEHVPVPLGSSCCDTDLCESGTWGLWWWLNSGTGS